MHFALVSNSTQSAVYKALQSLRSVVQNHQIWRPKEDVQFVFLCGANREPQIPSKRRELLLDFSLKRLPYIKVFFAETIFAALRAAGNKDNILDVESELSAFADHIIIILESERKGSVCQLV